MMRIMTRRIMRMDDDYHYDHYDYDDDDNGEDDDYHYDHHDYDDDDQTRKSVPPARRLIRKLEN